MVLTVEPRRQRRIAAPDDDERLRGARGIIEADGKDGRTITEVGAELVQRRRRRPQLLVRRGDETPLAVVRVEHPLRRRVVHLDAEVCAVQRRRVDDRVGDACEVEEVRLYRGGTGMRRARGGDEGNDNSHMRTRAAPYVIHSRPAGWWFVSRIAGASAAACTR